MIIENIKKRKFQKIIQTIASTDLMSSQQRSASQQLANYPITNSYQVQCFIQQFLPSSSTPTSKTFALIEDNFIKKYRYKNSLNCAEQANYKSNLHEFLQAFKECNNYYAAYHEYLQSTLEKFGFCRDLRKIMKDLYKSEQKTVNFLVNQIEFHRAFIEEKQAHYQTKVENMKEICAQCKENNILKSFEHLKHNVQYQFSDPYKLYDKPQPSPAKLPQLVSSINNGNYPIQSIPGFSQGKSLFHLDNLQQTSSYMRSLLKESRGINQNALQEIMDIFQVKEQAEMFSFNKVKINEMFYELQNELDNRANQIEEYLDEVMGFNERLVNYNPNMARGDFNGFNGNSNGQADPEIVDKELKFNFGKIVKKIYKKVTELIKKRKQESISVETQASFNQDTVIRQLQKQKKKLALQLKQCQQDKKYLSNSLRQQNQKLKSQVAQILQQKVKLQIAKQQAYSDKKVIEANHDKLVRVISQMKKEIERLEFLLERQKKRNNNQKKDSKGGKKVEIDESEVQLEKQRQNQKKTSKNLTVTENDKASKQSEKSPETEFLEELEKNELQLFKNLAKKRVNNRKKFMQPRRSKLLETLPAEESSLGLAMSRFSKMAVDPSELQGNGQNSQTVSPINQSQQNSKQEIEDGQVIQFEIPAQQCQAQNTESIKQASISHSRVPLTKNHKSKTFTQLSHLQPQIESHGQSSKQISQTSEDIHKQLEELQKIKKMKQIEMKLAQITKSKANKEQRSTVGFNIQKQESVSVGKNRFVSVAEGSNSSLGKNRLNAYSKSNAKLSTMTKKQLSNRFLKPNIGQTNPSKPGIRVSNQTQELKSSHSIFSINSQNLYQEINQIIEQNRSHVGIQTFHNEENYLLYVLFQEQRQKRKWNELIVSFESFKFGYEQFLGQLSQLIEKQEKNPIRKLNGYKGSTAVLKKNLNYRFNKENLFNRTWNQQSQPSELQKTNPNFSKTLEEKHYFVPKDPTKINSLYQTSSNIYQAQDHNKENHSLWNPTQKFLNCVTLSDFKSLNRFYKPSDDKKDARQGFKKKGFYTLHHVRTQNRPESSANDKEYSFDTISRDKKQQSKLPIISETLQPTPQIRIPSFQKEDAQNLFFSIESAKTFEQKLSQCQNPAQIIALQPQQIKFSTEILTILAHIHLFQPQSYQGIKSILLYPTHLLSNKTYNQLSPSFERKLPEQSLKQGLSYLIKLHRKCKTVNSTHNQNKAKSNINNKNLVCEHLMQFKNKISQLTQAILMIKNKANDTKK